MYGCSMTKPQKKKLTVEFNEDLVDALDRIASRQGVSKADVLRRAVGLMDYFGTVAEKGEKVAIVDADNNIQREIVMPGG